MYYNTQAAGKVGLHVHIAGYLCAFSGWACASRSSPLTAVRRERGVRHLELWHLQRKRALPAHHAKGWACPRTMHWLGLTFAHHMADHASGLRLVSISRYMRVIQCLTRNMRRIATWYCTIPKDHGRRRRLEHSNLHGRPQLPARSEAAHDQPHRRQLIQVIDSKNNVLFSAPTTPYTPPGRAAALLPIPGLRLHDRSVNRSAIATGKRTGRTPVRITQLLTNVKGRVL